MVGFPIGSYLDLVDSLARDRTQRAISFEEAALTFVEGYNNAVRQAMHNDYHWRRLAMPFHPADPDVLGVLLFADRAMKRSQSGSVMGMIENMPLAWESKAFLTGILTDYDNPEDNSADNPEPEFLSR